MKPNRFWGFKILIKILLIFQKCDPFSLQKDCNCASHWQSCNEVHVFQEKSLRLLLFILAMYWYLQQHSISIHLLQTHLPDITEIINNCFLNDMMFTFFLILLAICKLRVFLAYPIIHIYYCRTCERWVQ